MSFLESQKKPKALNNVPVTQSHQGDPVPVAMGCVKMHTSLLWMSGFVEQGESGGKGTGGGKGSEFYNYYSDVAAALCNGPITGVGSVWSGQTWLSAQGTDEQIWLSENYSPQNSALLIADNGVGIINTYSATYTDYGQPVSTVLNGSDSAPMVLVPWFPAAAAGTSYAVGAQVFNGADVYTSVKANTGEALSDTTYWTNTGAGLTTGQYSISFASIGTFTLTAAANNAPFTSTDLNIPSGNGTAYTGTITGGGSGAFIGYTFTVTGFQNPQNNGTYVCVASSASSLTLFNTTGVAETHAGVAEDLGNTYHFSSSDVGNNAVVSYQFNLSLVEQQDVYIVPDGVGVPGYPAQTVVLSQQYSPTSIISVQYYGEFNELAGTTLTQVSTNPPTEAGTFYFTPSNTNNPNSNDIYPTLVTFSTADIGQEVLITWGYTNQSLVGQDAPELINFTVFGGNMGQELNSCFEDGGTFHLGAGSSNAATITMVGDLGQILSYSGIAHVDYSPMYLGTSGQMPDNCFEVITPDAYGSGIVDCNPVQCIYRVLTDNRWGLGSGPVPFPVAAIDNSANGTWGGAVGTPGTRSVGSTAWNWCAANGYFISPKIDSQDSAASVISKWCEAGQIGVYVSEGLLKLVPYGSTSVAGNGCTWEGPQSYVVALDDTCFLAEEGKDPFNCECKEWPDAYNKVAIGFSNRSYQYNDDITQEFDQAAINRYGTLPEDPQNYDFIHTLSAATFVGSLRVKRSTSILNTYSGTLPFSYSYLEPMDIVTVSTSSIWAAGLNNVNLAVSNLPLRVTKTVDDPKKGMQMEFEDYIATAQEPVLFNKSISAGSGVINQLAAPGNTIAVMFEATSRLTNYQGNQIWIGACGSNSQWGSCNVWCSQDGETYLQIGTISAAARLGTIASTFPAGDDPDTSDTLVVNLAVNCPALDSGTDTDANYLNTMCFVDGEIIAYSAVTTTGQNQYTMGSTNPSLGGYIRRGQVGSQITSHTVGAAFLRLDNSIFKYTYDPKWAGETLYFKFQSLNNFGQNPQPLSSLTAVEFTVPGEGPGTIDAASGLIIASSSFNVGAGPFGTTPTVTT